MANTFTQNPFILDTDWTTSTIPSAIAIPAATDSTLGTPGAAQSFRYIVWEAPATAGDTVTVTDYNGNIILFGECAVAKQSVVLWDAGATRQTLNLKNGRWILSQISSGKLYMYK